MRKKRSGRRILFPWERERGLLRRLGSYRTRPIVLVAVALSLVVWIGVRERERAGIRQTRAVLLDVRRSIDLYQADHSGKCPKSLEDLSNYGSFKGTPRDSWAQPLGLLCPDPAGGRAYRLSSGGPDGIPGGLDRVQ